MLFLFHFDAWGVIVAGHTPAPSSTSFFTLIYLVLYWSANKFVLPLCVAGASLVSVDLCCCAEWVTSSSWFNLSYTRLKMDWIKDAEGLDLPILAVNSCLWFLLICFIFLPLTNFNSAEHWPHRISLALASWKNSEDACLRVCVQKWCRVSEGFFCLLKCRPEYLKGNNTEMESE